MKSFVASDMRTALRMVREALGEDAVILSNRRVAAGIELVAASEMPPEAPPTPRQQATNAGVGHPAAVARGYAQIARAETDFPEEERAPAISTDRRAGPVRGGGENRSGGWWQMQQELRAMRDLMEQQYSNFSWQQYRSQKPAQAAMWRRLQRLGLDAALVRELLEHHEQPADAEAVDTNGAWQHLMGQLSARVPVLADDLIERGGAFAFVGPTGAGKSTTIAKLAARYVLAHGNTDVALITTDSYRIGAHEQLRTLSRILNIPCRVVGTQLDLGTALYELRQCRLVLIDTAGFNPNAPELKQQLAALAELGDRVQCLQVLAANTQQQVLRNAHRAYRSANLAGCILTKLDEAGSLGEVLSLVIDSGVPLAYVADGQAIPGDIGTAQAKSLVAKAIALAKQNDCDEDDFAQAFGLPAANARSA
jgi:flagellar biosynthesis protein FlhF